MKPINKAKRDIQRLFPKQQFSEMADAALERILENLIRESDRDWVRALAKRRRRGLR